jgi:chorismate synthase
MASNSFGNIFRITTWGESHGKAIGVVIDGCPAGLEIDENEINAALALRAPGVNPYTSPRKETDKAQILSGVFEGKTTGAPISLLIPNTDADSSKYEPIKDLLRPGHANFTYIEKYGFFDYRGGGRASARETACRVAAGAIAQKLIERDGIIVTASIKQIGSVTDPDEMMKLIEKAKSEGDSLGGVVEFEALNVPVGLGDPVYEKLEARLAFALMSLPATKGFEIGAGFSSVEMAGSEHNDAFMKDSGVTKTRTNNAGGTLGGISTGMPLVGRVAFKPTSSIRKEQETVTLSGEGAQFKLPEGSRHDPCVAIRAVPVVKAMVALVLADALLLNRCAKVPIDIYDKS